MKSAVSHISRLLVAFILAATLTAQRVPAHSPVPPAPRAGGGHGGRPRGGQPRGLPLLRTVPAPGGGHGGRPRRAAATAALELEDILKQESFREAVTAIERNWEESYEDYFKANLAEEPLTAEDIGATLDRIGRKTGTRFYFFGRPDLYGSRLAAIGTGVNYPPTPAGSHSGTGSADRGAARGS